MKKLTQELDKNKLDTNKISTPKSKSTRSSTASGTAKIPKASGKSNKVKAANYKSAYKSAKAIEADKDLTSDKASKFLEDIKPYINKNGELRKNISKKRLEEFNEIVNEYKSSKGGASTKSKAKRQKRKALEKARERGTYSTKKEQNRVIDVMSSDAVKGLISKGMDSDQIVSLMKTFDHLTPKDFVDAAEYMLNKMESDIPEEAAGFLDQDDAYMELEEYLADMYGYDEDDEEDIPFL